MARIDTPTFESKVGLPPLVVEEERRDYAVMLLLNTLAPEYGCPSCKYPATSPASSGERP